jgi:hypothetical protein
MIFRSILAAAALLFGVSSAHAAFDSGDLICETTTTTGTGTLNLGGAIANYVTFVSQIATGSTVPYHIVASDGKLEVGTGTFVDAAPDTLSRTADWSTDGSGAELTLPAGSHTVCIGPITSSLVISDLSPQLGGDLDLLGRGVFDSTMTGEANFHAIENGFEMTATNDDAGGPYLSFYHNSTTPADGDIPAQIGVWGGADAENIGSIRMELDDGTSTSEDTKWQFVARQGGTDYTTLEVGGHSTSMYGLDSGDSFAVYASGATINAYLETTDDGAAGATLYLGHDSASPADGDIPANISVAAGADDETVGQIRLELDDGATTTEDTQWQFVLRTAGADLTALTLGGATYMADFNLGTNFSARLYSAVDGVSGPVLAFQHDDPSADANDYPGNINVYGGADDELIGTILHQINDPATTTEDSRWEFGFKSAGSLLTRFYVGANDTGTNAVFVSANGNLGLDNASDARFFEQDANGDNYKSFISAAANTADTACTFEDDANFIPDSCVGDGSDASDGRLKDILATTTDAGAMLDQIKIYDYQWNVDAPDQSEAVRKGNRGYGPVAQELFNVNPDWVEVGGEDAIDDPWTWKPEKLVPYLIAEIQNLRKRVQELETR